MLHHFSIGQDAYVQLLLYPLDMNIEGLPKCADSVQAHLVPFFWQTRSQVESVQPGRTDAEQSLREDAAIQSTLCREMSLTAFRPCLNGVRNMLTQEPPVGIELKIIHGFVHLTAGYHAAESIKC